MRELTFYHVILGDSEWTTLIYEYLGCECKVLVTILLWNGMKTNPLDLPRFHFATVFVFRFRLSPCTPAKRPSLPVYPYPRIQEIAPEINNSTASLSSECGTSAVNIKFTHNQWHLTMRGFGTTVAAVKLEWRGLNVAFFS